MKNSNTTKHRKNNSAYKISAKKEKIDMVNHPPHYTAYATEVIDIIEKMLTPEEFKGYLKGNIIKYRLRAGLKGGKDIRQQDWEKSCFYQDRLFAIDK
jgi:hypothetical protein